MASTFNTHISLLTKFAIVYEKSTVLHVFLYKSLGYKIRPCREIGQGQPGSSFEQTMIGRNSHRHMECHIPRFIETGPLVLEKIFEGFLPYTGMGMAAIMVM